MDGMRDAQAGDKQIDGVCKCEIKRLACFDEVSLGESDVAVRSWQKPCRVLEAFRSGKAVESTTSHAVCGSASVYVLQHHCSRRYPVRRLIEDLILQEEWRPR